MATVLGMRGTGTFPSDFKHNDIRASYTYLMPNGDAPLNAILAMTKKTSAKTTRFEWPAQPFIQRRGASRVTRSMRARAAATERSRASRGFSRSRR